MKPVLAEVVDSGQKKDARGRKIVREEERVALIAEYERSGLTQKAFAQREGIKFCTLVSWLSRRRKGQTPAFAELPISGQRDDVLEIVLADGVTLRGRSADQLANLLAKLRQC